MKLQLIQKIFAFLILCLMLSGNPLYCQYSNKRITIYPIASGYEGNFTFFAELPKSFIEGNSDLKYLWEESDQRAIFFAYVKGKVMPISESLMSNNLQGLSSHIQYNQTGILVRNCYGQKGEMQDCSYRFFPKYIFSSYVAPGITSNFKQKLLERLSYDERYSIEVGSCYGCPLADKTPVMTAITRISTDWPTDKEKAARKTKTDSLLRRYLLYGVSQPIATDLSSKMSIVFDNYAARIHNAKDEISSLFDYSVFEPIQIFEKELTASESKAISFADERAKYIWRMIEHRQRLGISMADNFGDEHTQFRYLPLQPDFCEVDWNDFNYHNFESIIINSYPTLKIASYDQMEEIYQYGSSARHENHNQRRQLEKTSTAALWIGAFLGIAAILSSDDNSPPTTAVPITSKPISPPAVSTSTPTTTKESLSTDENNSNEDVRKPTNYNNYEYINGDTYSSITGSSSSESSLSLSISDNGIFSTTVNESDYSVTYTDAYGEEDTSFDPYNDSLTDVDINSFSLPITVTIRYRKPYENRHKIVQVKFNEGGVYTLSIF